MTYGAFIASNMGMMSMSEALSQISANIANINTTGYKSVDPMFQEMLSSSDALGNKMSVSVYNRINMDETGIISSTKSSMDVAIDGQGYFMLSKYSDGSGLNYFTRAGDFTASLVGDNAYLTNYNDMYVMGWNNPDELGTAGAPSPLEIQYADIIPGRATENVSLIANINSEEENALMKFQVCDDTGEIQSAILKLNYSQAFSGWMMDLNLSDSSQITPGANQIIAKFNTIGQITGLEQITYDGEYQGKTMSSITWSDGVTRNVNEAPPIADEEGEALSPLVANWEDGTSSNITITQVEDLSYNVTWADGEVTDINFDFSNLTQYAAETQVTSFNQDGYTTGELSELNFNASGVLTAAYTNGFVDQICKLAVVSFPNLNGLEKVSDNMFAYNGEAGEMVVINSSIIRGESLEGSNVNLEDEFTKMIKVQKAYSSSATAFKTADEMTQEITNLI